MNNCENCIEGRPRIGRLAGVTRTMRLAIFEGEGVPTGTPQDLTAQTVVVRVLLDGTNDIYVPDFVVEGTGNNVIKFVWPANRQTVGNYTLDVTMTDGGDNVNRVNWHGKDGIRLVQYSNQVYGEDATGQESSEAVGLVGYFTANGVGMSAFDEWRGSEYSEGYPQTVAGFMAYLKQPATDAANAARQQMQQIQSRADEDHTRAGNDHSTAESDHTRAEGDHTTAASDHTTAAADHTAAAADHTQAGNDHTRAEGDHTTAASDHTQAAADHTQAASDHSAAAADRTRAGQDHTRSGSDHEIAVADHAQAEADHTRAESDHGTAAADHTQAGADHSTAAADHTLAASDHSTAAADHTQAVADHAVMEGYDTRLTNVEEDVTQLGQEMVLKTDLPIEQLTLSNYTSYNHIIVVDTGLWNTNSSYKHYAISLLNVLSVKITANSTSEAQIAWLTASGDGTTGEPAPFVTGTSVISVPANTEVTLQVPEGALYLYIRRGGGSGTNQYTPETVKFVTPIVEDSIASTSVQKALSAKQGNLLARETLLYCYTGASTVYKIPKVRIVNLYYMTAGGVPKTVSLNTVFDLSENNYLVLNTQTDEITAISDMTNLPRGCVVLLKKYSSNDTIAGGALYGDYLNKTKQDTLSEYETPVVEYDEKAISTSGELVSASEGAKTKEYSVTAGSRYLVNGYCPSASSGTVLLAYYDSEETFISYEHPNRSAAVNKYTILVPAGTTKIRVFGHNSYREASLRKLEDRQQLTIMPYLAYRAVTVTDGGFHAEYKAKTALATQRFIRCDGMSFVLKSSVSANLRVLLYSKTFEYIGYIGEYLNSGYISLTADTEKIINIYNNATYVKLQLSSTTSGGDVPKTTITLTGAFPSQWDIYNPRPSGGYQRIIAMVNVTNPTCCDTDTDSVQDVETDYDDYGLIALPTQYSEIGEPTRLIIYCHGSAVHYKANVSSFDSDDLEPDYWLSEGYAVMDMDGNPFDHTTSYGTVPQAIESYYSAYQWVINAYNIRRDGVFLGGRSQGGNMALNLARKECPLPVIATCPNVPGCNILLRWETYTAERRAFNALHLGFTGTAPTWTGDSPMTAAEWQFLQDNYEKLAKSSAFWNMITDLPEKAELFEHNGVSMNISKSATSGEGVQAEADLYAKLHATIKCPCKIFLSRTDATNNPHRHGELVYKMLANAGQIAELRWFNGSGHHYDIQDDNLRTDITNSYGVLMEDIPVVYVEMLQFWKRYEQQH